MTVELGQATLDVADDLFKLTGGAESLVSIGKNSIPVLGGLAAAMVTFRLSTAAANAEFGLLSKGLGALALVPLAAGLGTSIGSFVEDKRVELLFRDLNKLKEEDRKFLDDFTKNQKSARDAFNATNDARVQAALQANRELNRLYLLDVANAKTAAEKKAAFEKFKSGSAVDETVLGLLLKRKLTSPDQVAQGIIDAQKKAAELKAEFDAAVAGEQGIERLRGNLTQVFSDLDRLQSSRAVADQGLRDQFGPIFDELRRLRGDSQITEDELANIIELRNKLGTDVFEGGGILGTGFASIDKIGFASTLNQLDEALRALQEIQRIQGTIGDSGLLQGELEAFQAVLEQAAPDVAFQAATNALQAGVTPAQAIESAMVGAANAAERLAAAQTGDAVGRFNGGMMSYFANGGRGQDTIPAMLSPNEFVVNPKSTAKFFSQLQAINAGQTPVFRQDGGGVTNNTTVGDIHVHGGQSPEKTGRAVMREIRRELRRGSGRL